MSNLPYIDAAEILDKVLAWPHFQTAVFMFQKEQAQKITAKPGEKGYGALSVLSQLRARISLICNVGKGCFNPPPKVDSRVLAFEKITSPDNWSYVQKLVQTAFLHRRKTLLNALILGGYQKDKILSALEQLNLPLTVRPEQLSAQQYVELAKEKYPNLSHRLSPRKISPSQQENPERIPNETRRKQKHQPYARQSLLHILKIRNTINMA